MFDQDIVDIIFSQISGYETEAEEIGRSRFMILCTDIGANPAEIAEIERIANSFRYSLTKEGSELILSKEMLQSPFSEIIENGMDAPVTGGENGIVHMPNGETTTSKVPVQLWGHEIPEYAKRGTEAFTEMDKIQSSLFPKTIRDTAQSSKQEFSELAKKEIIEKMPQWQMGGFG